MTVTTPSPPDTAAPVRRRRPVGEPPPLPHEFSRSGWVLIIAASAVATLWIMGATVFRELGIWFNEVEGVYVRWVVDHRAGWLTDVLDVVHTIFYSWAVPLIGWATMILLLAARRFRHLLVYFGALMATSGIVVSMMPWIGRPRPWMVEQLVAWEGYSHPSLAVAQLTAVCVGAAYALIPAGRNRMRVGILISVVVAIFGFSRVYFGVEYPMDPLNGAIVGAAIMSVGFLLICPEAAFPVGVQRGRTAHLDVTGPRGDAICAALQDQLGLDVKDVQPVGQAESAGSTPMRITVAGKITVRGDSTTIFAKLYATSHLRSDRWYKLGRALLYGRLEDESRFQNVRRLVEREDYLMRTMRDAGVRIPEPLGIAEITPEREYLIVTEFLEGAEEITDAEIDDEIIDKGLAMVRNMWDHGLAHRDIKPANIMVRGSDAYIIDVAFGQIRPSPWREAVDLGNMMLTLALRSSPEKVYERALLRYSPAEIAEAFAASRGVTMPSQLRRELKKDPRDLVKEFHRLACPGNKLRIQRWTLRRIGLLLWVTIVAMIVILFGVGNLAGIGLL
jgi:tRNA A-37 threonylcarbamoyl transferase component Bud32/membrane-associated phospholipid phosphatase